MEDGTNFLNLHNLFLLSHLLSFFCSYVQGTIVEWTVQVGQAVQPEDVVALIETDKVTVDIKATVAGVLTQQYGAV